MTKPQICKTTAVRWARNSQTELAERLGVTPSAVSQWDEDLPEGRAWQLFALGCPQDSEMAEVEQTGAAGGRQ